MGEFAEKARGNFTPSPLTVDDDAQRAACICWEDATAILFMAKRITFVKADGMPCTTSSGEKANSGAPPVLVAFGDYDAMRLRQFAAEHGGALVDGWKLFEAASLFSEAPE
jgi:hypothetical protein